MRYQKLLTVLLTMMMVIGANAQEQDTVYPIYPWMKLRDSSNPVGLKEIKIQCNRHDEQEFHDQSQFTNVEEYLERAPGLTMIGRGAFGKEPVLNGMNTDRVQVTIDGMPVMNACIGKMDPATSYVETNNLKEVEIENGGDGLAMTSNAGGNINFKTLDPKLSCCGGISGNAGVAYQSNGNGRHSFLKIGTGNEEWGLLVNGSYRSSDSYRAGDGSVIANSQFNKANIALAGKWKINERQILDADVIIDEAWNIGYPALPMDVPRASAQIASVEWKQYQVTDRINWVRLKAFGNRVHHVMDNFSRSDYTMLMTMPGTTWVTGLRGETQISKSKKERLNIMAEAIYRDFVASMTMFPENEQEMYMLTWPDVSDFASAVFTRYSIRKEKFDWSISGRLEGSRGNSTSQLGINQWEGLGVDISAPNLRLTGGSNSQFTYKPNEKWSGYARAAYLVRRPTVSEQFGLYLFNASDGFAYLGDPNINNEKSAQITLGLQKKGKHLSASGEGFYYQFTDYIVGVINEGLQPLARSHNGVKRFTNLPTAVMAGWNAELTTMPLKGWLIYLSGEYVMARDGEGNYLPFIPPLTVTGGSKYRFKKGYVSMECISAAAQEKVSIYGGEDATGSYTLFNAFGGYDIEVRGKVIKLSLKAENLANAHYWRHLDWNNMSQTGRNITGSIAVKF